MDGLNLPAVMLAIALIGLIFLNIGKRMNPPHDDDRRVMLRVAEISLWGIFAFTLPLTLLVLLRR